MNIPKPGCCPACGAYANEIGCVTDPNKNALPVEGDISLCAYCGEIEIFNADLSLRSAELKDLMQMSELHRAKIGKAQEIIRKQRIPQ